MTNHRPSLPDFTNPPLVEVVLGIQFDPLPRLDALQMGRLWSEFRDGYPKHEIQPMLAPQFETFEGPVSEELSLPMGLELPQWRYWFLKSDETALIQVQVDRLLLNWRQRGAGSAYPRYKSMRDNLEQAIEKFRNFLQSEDLGDIVPNQCEITYVNHMEQGKGWVKPSEASAVFPGFSGRWSSGFLPELDDVRAALRFVIRVPGQDNPVGRLHAQIETRYRRDSKAPLLALTLTARMCPAGKNVSDALSSIDVGHEWIVRGFTALTSKQMQTIWGRCDV